MSNENDVIKLSKPYNFEGKEYTEIDLSAIEELSTKELCQAERIFERSGGVSAMKELNTEYACIVAAQVTNQPIEFFKGLPAKDGNKVKTRVGAYFFE